MKLNFDSSHHIGERCYKSPDGIIYQIAEDGQSACVKSSDEDIMVDANIAEEIEVDGNVYAVTKIGVAAFLKRKNLKTVSLPKSLLIIENHAFEECDLDSITFEKNITKIEMYAFYRARTNKLILNGCRGINLSSLREVSNLYCDSFDTLLGLGQRGQCWKVNIFVEGKEITKLIIPEGVTSIPSLFIAGCKGVTEVIMPSSLKSIGSEAFRNCTSLEKIELPEGLEKIGGYSFADCTSLSHLEIPSTVAAIESGAFHTSAIESAVIPEGAQIGNSVFQACYKLNRVYLPSNLQTIPSDTFSYCVNLEEVSIPENVLSIERNAFFGCKISSIELPSGLKRIGRYAFAFLPISEIRIPASVTEIEECIFEGCENLTSVYSDIDDPAGCEIASVELPAKKACKCGQINGPEFEMGKEIVYKQATLYVPNIKGMIAAYKKKAAWKKFSSILLAEA